MTEIPRPISLAVLSGFQLERVLDEDPRSRTASLLGSFPSKESEPSRERAILLLEKIHFNPQFYSEIGSTTISRPPSKNSGKFTNEEGGEPCNKVRKVEDEEKPTISSNDSCLSRLASLGQNDIYTWLLGWKNNERYRDEADFKINMIRPVDEKHIAKYSSQKKFMVYETPTMYENLVEPWILSQPASRINWAYNILEKKKESESILYEDADPETGFIILPDLKWDKTTLSSLYLVAIVHDRSLRSLRDLRPSTSTGEPSKHVELLEKVGAAAVKISKEKFGLEGMKMKNQDGNEVTGSPLRCFIHYHPTYYHLHIHLLSSSQTQHPGALTGQAHLLEDVIDLLKLGVDFRKRTIGFAIGERSEIWKVLSSDKDSGKEKDEGTLKEDSR